MKAAVFLGNAQIEIQEIPTPTPADGQVLVKINACGVCGTDIHIYHGELTEGVVPPVVLGHEMTGQVEAIGKTVTDVQLGENVCIDPLVGCGLCQHCRVGRPNLCPAPTLIGYKLNGGFAQYVLAPATSIYKLDPKVGHAGGILAETLACVLNGYDRLQFQAGKTALILGAGTVGLLWNNLLKAPSSCLLQSEPVAFRRNLAGELGADIRIDPQAAPIAEQLYEHLADGVDYIVDASGDPTAIEEAIPLLAPGGTFMIFGVCPQDARININPFELYSKEARIIASKMPPRALGRAAALIESGAIDTERIVTARLPLAKLSETMSMFTEQRSRQVKMCIDPWA
jgi:L-iditol 2-dehydrogenase